jgi:predicted DNA-binding transcriptional regulator YafY
MALELLQGSPGITAERLAGTLGVTERAVRRYIGILREAGIPVESTRGPYGGYRVGRGLRLPPLSFSSVEALGLVMAVLDGHHEAGDPLSPVGSARGKIMRALPEPVAAQAEAVRRTTAPAPDRGAARPDPGITTTLVEACSDHRLVRLDYRSEAGSEWTLEVEPWAVVVRHGRWYLLCRLPERDRLRAYRVDRVRSAQSLATTFTPPADLEPIALLERSLASGWEYRTTVEFQAPFATVAPHVPWTLGTLTDLGDRARLTGTTGNPYWYAERLVAVPARFRILGGPELREATRVLGERMVAAAGLA